MAETTAQKKARIEAELVKIRSAISVAIEGGQSYSIAGRSLVRQPLDCLYKKERELENRLLALENGGLRKYARFNW